jgi:hypothetical protein
MTHWALAVTGEKERAARMKPAVKALFSMALLLRISGRATRG